MTSTLSVNNHGSLYVITPSLLSHDAFWAWVEENVGGEYQTWGSGLVVEPRYVDDILAALDAEGIA